MPRKCRIKDKKLSEAEKIMSFFRKRTEITVKNIIDKNQRIYIHIINVTLSKTVQSVLKTLFLNLLLEINICPQAVMLSSIVFY